MEIYFLLVYSTFFPHEFYSKRLIRRSKSWAVALSSWKWFLFFNLHNFSECFLREETLMRIANSADSLAVGDLIENAIRGNGAWSLLPTQACFSSVIPGTLMAGRLNAQANFPSWLGRNSKRGKFDRYDAKNENNDFFSRFVQFSVRFWKIGWFDARESASHKIQTFSGFSSGR